MYIHEAHKANPFRPMDECPLKSVIVVMVYFLSQGETSFVVYKPLALEEQCRSLTLLNEYSVIPV